MLKLSSLVVTVIYLFTQQNGGLCDDTVQQVPFANSEFLLLRNSLDIAKIESELASVTRSLSSFSTDSNNNGSNWRSAIDVSAKNLPYNDELCAIHRIEITKQLLRLIRMEMPDPWFLYLFDSWGKIPAGLMSGHMRDLGHFGQCLKYKHQMVNENNASQITSFKGQYCTTLIPMQVIEKLLNISLNVQPGLIPGPQGLQLGSCWPDTCKPEQLNNMFRRLLSQAVKSKDLPEKVVYGCQIDKQGMQFTAADIIALVVFSSVGLCMLLSSIYDYHKRLKDEKPNDLLVAFSVITNGQKLFKMSPHRSPNTIGCLNGIRCISIVWIVFGHSYITYATGNVMNMVDVGTWFQSVFAATFQFGTISVDTFLFLSGLLIIWSAFKEMEKTKGRLNILMMYVHRYLRLTPALAATVLFCVSFVKYIGSGPNWEQNVNAITSACETNWWATLIYIQNYKIESPAGQTICIPQTWYLAVDTQLYVLSPLVLIPLWKWGRKCILPIIVLALFSNACVFSIFMKYEFSTIRSTDQALGPDRMRLTYMPTHARYAPWLIGIIVGYLLFESRNKKINLSKLVVFSGWLLSIAVMMAVIFGPYHRIADFSAENAPTIIESAFYEALSRSAWAWALAWIVFACHKGYGGPVNSMLSWPVWETFGRLSYSMYIVHFILQYMVNANQKSDRYFEDFDAIYKFWGDFGLTLCVSVVLALAFESPIVGIEKVLFKRGAQPKADRKPLTTGEAEPPTDDQSMAGRYSKV